MADVENATLYRFDQSFAGDLSAVLEPAPLPEISGIGNIPLDQARIAFGDKQFDVFHTDPRDHIFQILKNSRGFYEASFLSAIARHLQPGDLVVDGGANIGNHTLFFAGVLGCRVASFEPGDSALRLLQHNIVANGLASRVDVWPYALAEFPGQFSPDGGDGVQTLGLGALTLRADTDGLMRGTPLDEASFDQRVKLFKIDVEGMEIEVLRGARKTLLRDRPVICVECDHVERFNRLFDFLLDLGFLAIESHNYTATHVFVPVDQPTELEAKFSRQLALQYILHGHQIHALSGRLTKLESVIRRIQALGNAQTAARN